MPINKMENSTSITPKQNMYAYTRKAHKFKQNTDLNMVHCYNLQMGPIFASLCEMMNVTIKY